MSFHTKRNPDATTVLCFDVPKQAETRMLEILSQQQYQVLHGISAMQNVLLDVIVELYDISVWALRDEVRRIEKSRNDFPRPETDYPALHEFARHAIHSTETLGVAMNTVDGMIRHHEAIVAKQRNVSADRLAIQEQMRQYMQFQLQLLTSLRARSEANESRLRNEINLTFNMVAQSQNNTTLLISRATQSDGAAMKTVAIVTLTFLPATFVSALFSMSFFSFSPGSSTQEQSMIVSKQIWVYWLVVIPLTALTMGAWFFWQYRQHMSIKA